MFVGSCTCLSLNEAVFKPCTPNPSPLSAVLPLAVGLKGNIDPPGNNPNVGRLANFGAKTPNSIVAGAGSDVSVTIWK